MRTVYLGTSAFAAGVLERLAQTAHRPVLVVKAARRRPVIAAVGAAVAAVARLPAGRRASLAVDVDPQ